MHTYHCDSAKVASNVIGWVFGAPGPTLCPHHFLPCPEGVRTSHTPQGPLNFIESSIRKLVADSFTNILHLWCLLHPAQLFLGE